MKLNSSVRILALVLICTVVLSAVPVLAANTNVNGIEVLDFIPGTGYGVSVTGKSVNITIPYSYQGMGDFEAKGAVNAVVRRSVTVNGAQYTTSITSNGFDKSIKIKGLSDIVSVPVSYTLTRVGGSDTITGTTTYGVFISKSPSFYTVERVIDPAVGRVSVLAGAFGVDKLNDNFCASFELTSGTVPAYLSLLDGGAAYVPGSGRKVASLDAVLDTKAAVAYGESVSFAAKAYDSQGKLIGEGTLKLAVKSPVLGEVKASVAAGETVNIPAAAYTTGVCPGLTPATVRFTALPAASQGTVKVGGAAVSANRDYNVGDLSFTAAAGYKGTASASYVCTDSKGSTYRNTIAITVGAGGKGSILKKSLFTLTPVIRALPVDVSAQEVADAVDMQLSEITYITIDNVPAGLSVFLGAQPVSGRWQDLSSKLSIRPVQTGTFNINYTVFGEKVVSGVITVEVSDGKLPEAQMIVSYDADPAKNLVSFKDTAQTVLKNAKELLGTETLGNIDISMLPYSIQGTLSSTYGTFYTDSAASSPAISYAHYTEESFKGLYYAPTEEVGSVQLTYVIYDSNNEYFVTGTVNIVRQSKGSVEYSTTRNNTVYFKKDDFAAAATKALGAGYTLTGIRFVTSDAGNGDLFYAATNAAPVLVDPNTDYTAAMLDSVCFKPDNNYIGTANSVGFTGTAGNAAGAEATFAGTVTITVREQIDVFYQVTAGKSVTLSEKDILAAFPDVSASDFQGMIFTSLPESGAIYENYNSGSATNAPATVSKVYYPSANKSLTDKDVLIDKLTFVTGNTPANATLTVGFIVYGNKTKGVEKSGVMQIHVTKGDVATISGSAYCTGALFSGSSFDKICKSATGEALDYVEFILPDANNGSLFYGYKSATEYESKVSAAAKYYASGTQSLISKVAFVPVAGFSGAQEIRYNAYDVSGNWYRGVLKITIVSKEKSSTFTDVAGIFKWAADSVDFLYSNGVTTGTSKTTYGPKQNIKRGDFVLMLYRAFGLSKYDSAASATANFSDVKSDAYYASAIKVARYLEIAQGNGKTFSPESSITREEALALIYRTLNKTGWKLNHKGTASYTSFKDTNKVSSYAVDCMKYFVSSGVVVGSGGKLNPKQYITRAEMAVTLHRVLTY